MDFKTRHWAGVTRAGASLRTLTAGLALLAASSSPANDPVITEFCASNKTIIVDDEGDASDYIEIFNAGAVSVNLAGWHLTDDALNRTLWTFPSVTLGPQDFLLVFASGKDRRDPAAPLHTNFKLDAAGGYLALIQPDGVTPATEFAPTYPQQYEDYSYGLQQNAEFAQLLASGAPARTLVPTSGALGSAWTGRTFVDTSWTSGTTGVGYDRNPDYTALIGTDLRGQMDGINGTVYTRIHFNVADPGLYTGLFLKMKYDDGFIAYLNGTEVAERNAPASPAWNSDAAGQHDDALAVVFEEFNISDQVGRLVAGDNVLAIQGLNAGTGSSDLLILPELQATSAGVLDRASREYFPQPSPKIGNLPGYPTVAPKPDFSEVSGTFTGSFDLSIIKGSPQSTVRYTTNGTDPTESSTLYSAPLAISASTLVRARGYLTGAAPSPVVSRSFLRVGTNAEGFTSNLPILILDTFGRGVSDAAYTSAFLSLIETGPNGRAAITALPAVMTQAAIKYRGSSSLGFPKKNYALELRDDYGGDLDLPLLDIPEESDWVLHGPYSDKSLMRNYLTYLWSNRIGRYATRSRFVEMYVNTGAGNIDSADYVGVYVLMEKIKRGKDRVDVKRLPASASTAPDITGGYILKKDRLDPGDGGLTTQGGQTLGYVYPKEEHITAAQRAYIKGYLDEFEVTLNGPSYRDRVNGYAKYIDVDAFIDHHIMVEVTKNIDGFRLSTFMFKEREGKLAMGPVWDYNLSLGNANYLQGWIPQGFYYPQLGAGDYPWYGRLFQDPDFVQRYRDRWTALRRSFFQRDQLFADIDATAVFLDESQTRNFQRWNVLGTYVWPNQFIGPTYVSEIQFMADWLDDRLIWWDSQYPVAPSFNQHGGPIPSGFALTVSAPTSPIYYTLDGSDPRLSGGAIAPGAQTYSAPITLTQNTRVIARIRVTAGSWSGAADATFVVKTPPIVVTELMYHPAPAPADGLFGEEDFEFLELKNVGAETVPLAGFRFQTGISYTFGPAVAPLGPGELVVLVKNRAAFVTRYDVSGMRIDGEYQGNLDSGGERLELLGPLNEPVLDFTYSDTWEPTTDGQGKSLVIVDPHAATDTWSLATSWQASADLGGSPGLDEGAGPAGGRQLPGDVNQDAVLDLSDAIALLLRLFAGGAGKPLPCDGVAAGDGGNLIVFDINGDATLNVSDVIHILSFLFQQGPSPSRGTNCIRVEGCPTACGS